MFALTCVIETKKIEDLATVYSVKNFSLWEVEKGNKVASLHVVVKQSANHMQVQEQIQKIVGVKDCTIQLIYLNSRT